MGVNSPKKKKTTDINSRAQVLILLSLPKAAIIQEIGDGHLMEFYGA